MKSHDTDVLIIGAGPVGLTLALELASRQVKVTIVETRPPAQAPNVRCNHVAARSMEIFRRLGVAQALRDAGLPADYPNDVSYRTSATGREITRIKIPCRRDRFTDTSGPDGWWPTPEPPHRINQIYLEPILFRFTAQQQSIRILNRCSFQTLQQDDAGVSATIHNLDTGHSEQICAAYLVGCDGGRSQVRREIGASFQGDAVVQRVQSTLIDAPDLIDQMQEPPAWAMFSLNPRRSGNIYAIDGQRRWLVHNYLRENEPEFDSVDRAQSIRHILGVADSFSYDVISHEDWIGRRLIADRFRQDRVFLCGDSAHIWVPYAGYGMNAGIADAANLGWLIAATINGWASASILDAFEAERMPITGQVSHFAMDHSHQMAKRRKQVPADIEADTPQAQVTREQFGRDIYELNVQQYCCAGLNFGYYYDQSPIIIYDTQSAPDYAMGTFTESTVPGCRLPHRWLDGGTSLYDRLGPAYTVVRTTSNIDPTPILNAASNANLPMTYVDLAGESTDPRHSHALMIVRTDQHIAWRANQLPALIPPLIRTLAART